MSIKNFLNFERKFVSKPWGYEDWIANSPLYCGKDLFIKKDKRLSLHYHKLKTETFFIQSGIVELVFYQDVALDERFKSWDDFDKIVYTYGETMEDVERYPADLEEVVLNPGDSFQVPVGMRHTLFAFQDAHIFEFSTQHFDEDSIKIICSSTFK